MLLKKNNREIRFLQLTLQQKIKNSREEAHEFQAPIDERDPLEACMLQLQQKYAEDPKNLSCLRHKDKLRHAIRSFSFDEADRLLTILWGVGDKDTTNPSIWNDSTDLSRTVEVADDERVACTGHMVLSLAYMPQLRGYMACMEEVQQLGASNLENVLNHFFRQHISLQRQDEVDSHKAYPLAVRVKIAPLASRDFEEAMRGRRPIAIVAETAGTSSRFDEKFERTEKEYCMLKANRGASFAEFKERLRGLHQERRFKRYTIKYEELNKTQRSLSVNDSDLAQHDLDTYLFSQRDQFNLDRSIEQFCDEIHEELERKMKASLLAEQRKLLEEYQDPQ